MKKAFLLSFFLPTQLFCDAQNVGIGTAGPSRAKLEVHGGVGNTAAIFGGDTTGVSLQSNWPTVGFNEYFNGTQRYMAKGYAAQQFLDPNLGYMALDIFRHGQSDAPALASRRLIAFTYTGSVIMGDGQGRVLVNRNLATNSAAATLEINQYQGRGIGLIDPPSGFQWQISTVNGSPSFLSLEYNGTLKGYFKSVTGEYVVFSDRRLKTNVKTLPSLLDKVLRLRPVAYEMKGQNPAHEKTVGFIAQEVKEIFPGLVDTVHDAANPDVNGLYALRYNAVGVLAIKAIQEQQKIIQSLQARVAELKKAVSERRKQ